MKKTLFAALVLGCFFAAPVLTQAAAAPLLPQQKDAIGITDATFRALKQSHCYLEYMKDAPGATVTPLGRHCDALLARFENKLVMRVQHHGELYWINTGDGVPPVNRYLPDGLYATSQNAFLVSNGTKLRLQKGEAFEAILAIARSGSHFITTISNNDVQLMLGSCEYYGEGDPLQDSAFQACVSRYNAGRVLGARLAGRIVMNVDDSGKLFYIENTQTDTYMVELGLEMWFNGKQVTFMQFANAAAQPIQRGVIKQLAPAQ